MSTTKNNLSEKEVEIIQHLVSAINEVKFELSSKSFDFKKLNPKQIYLITIFGAVNCYTEGILELCKMGRPDPSIPILRSLTEAWINSLYILTNSKNKSLYLYSIEDTYNRKASIQLYREFYKKYPKQKVIFNEQGLSKLEKKLENELKVYETNLGMKFLNKKEFDIAYGKLIDRARIVDNRLKKRKPDNSGSIEHNYLIVYKHLSEFTHLSMRGISNFLKEEDQNKALIMDRNYSDIEQILTTLYLYYLYFANKLKYYKLINNPLKEANSYANKSIIVKN